MVDSLFVPRHWSEKDILKHPFDAVAWARAMRKPELEALERNASLDSGWTPMTATNQKLAECDRVESAALRHLFGRADELLRTLLGGFDSTEQFCKFHKIDKRWAKEARELLLASQKLGKT